MLIFGGLTAILIIKGDLIQKNCDLLIIFLTEMFLNTLLIPLKTG